MIGRLILLVALALPACGLAEAQTPPRTQRPPAMKAQELKSALFGIRMVGVADGTEAELINRIFFADLFAGSGIRLKILEGMALGKAIVSTPLGAQGIAVNNGEHLLLAQNAEEFASAIVALLRNPQKLQSMQLAAQKLAKDFYDNTKVIERVLSFYNDLRKDK